ncbi:GNAT family N-acetyltransferase [Verrucomicrobiota bacterium]
MSTAIFDLDGTIADPAEGITRSINYALAGLGHPPHPEEALRKYIGPHLNITFSELTGTTDKTTLARAIELYRERYMSIGYRENRLYDGMREVLSRLLADGTTLCVATTKRADIATKVLQFLDVDGFFSQVHGCDLHRRKSDLLREILSDVGLAARPAVMIGDRDTDSRAAAEVDMPSIAVRWGYGTDDELALATLVVDAPSELPGAVEKAGKRAAAIRPGMRRRTEMDKVALRPATEADSAFAFDVKKAALGVYVRETYGWDEEEQRRLHEQRFHAARTRIITFQGRDIGLVATREADDRIQFLQLFLLPEAQGKGIGSRVLGQVLGEAARTRRPVVLRVLKCNPRARAFYERHGFALTGETETHYCLERG